MRIPNQERTLIRRLRAQLSYANVMSTIALVAALGGGVAFAASTVKKDSVTSKSIKNSSIKGLDVLDDGLTGADVKEATVNLSAGPRGPTGDPGPKGEPGANGSPDTAAQVLDKIKQVDGTGSGLDAEKFDGRSSCQTNGTLTLDDDDPAQTICSRAGASLSVECNINGSNQTTAELRATTATGPSAFGFSGFAAAAQAGTSGGIGGATDVSIGSNGPTADTPRAFYAATADGSQLAGVIGTFAESLSTTDGTCYFVVGGIG